MKSFKSLLEKRVVPFPETNLLVTLQKHVRENKLVCVQFADVDKFGLNPQNRFGTPTGIYCYPIIEDFKNTLERHNEVPYFPYAKERRYVNIFTLKPSAKILNLGDLKEKDLVDILKKIPKEYSIIEIPDNFKSGYIILNKQEYQYKKNAKIKSIGGYLWYITMVISYFFSNSKHKWAAIFKDLGYDIIIDNKSEGIIHGSEPLQAVVVSGIRSVKFLERVDKQRVNYGLAMKIEPLVNEIYSNTGGAIKIHLFDGLYFKQSGLTATEWVDSLPNWMKKDTSISELLDQLKIAIEFTTHIDVLGGKLTIDNGIYFRDTKIKNFDVCKLPHKLHGGFIGCKFEDHEIKFTMCNKHELISFAHCKFNNMKLWGMNFHRNEEHYKNEYTKCEIYDSVISSHMEAINCKLVRCKIAPNESYTNNCTYVDCIDTLTQKPIENVE